MKPQRSLRHIMNICAVFVALTFITTTTGEGDKVVDKVKTIEEENNGSTGNVMDYNNGTVVMGDKVDKVKTIEEENKSTTGNVMDYNNGTAVMGDKVDKVRTIEEENNGSTGNVMDYNNGTVVKRMTLIEKVRTDVINPSTQSPVPSLDTFRQMIEQVVGEIVEKKMRRTSESISDMSKDIQAIKGIQGATNEKISSVLSVQENFTETFVNDRNAAQNAMAQVQSNLKSIESNQNVTHNHIRIDIIDARDRLFDKLNTMVNDYDKKAKHVADTLLMLENVIKNLEANLVNKVDKSQKLSLRALNEIGEDQKNRSSLNEIKQLNVTRDLLEKEITRIHKYHNSLSNDLKRIETVNGKIENGIADIKYKLAKGIESVKNNSNLNTEKLVEDFEGITGKSRHLLEGIRELVLNQTLSSSNNGSELREDLNDLKEIQRKFSKETLDAINESTKQLLSEKTDLSDIFSKSLENQQRALNSVVFSTGKMGNEIQNATDVLLHKINVTQDQILTSLQEVGNSLKNNQNNTSKRIFTKFKSSVHEIRLDFLNSINTLLQDITNKVENATHKVGNDLSGEINTFKEALSQTHVLIKGLEREINNSNFSMTKQDAKGDKENDNLIKLNAQYQNLMEIMETLRETQKIKLKDVIKEIRDTKNTLKKSIEEELQGAGLKNKLISNDIQSNLETIKHIQNDTHSIGRNIEKQINIFQNNTCNISKVQGAISNILNNTLQIILDDSDKKKIVMSDKMEFEVNKILNKMYATHRNLSQDLEKLENHTKSELLNGARYILNKIDDNKVDEKILRNDISNNSRYIKEEIVQLGRLIDVKTHKLDEQINHYLSSMRKNMYNIDNKTKECNDKSQVNLMNKFNEIKALMKIVIGLLQSSDNKTQTNLEEANQKLLRLDEGFMAAINDQKNLLSHQSSNCTENLVHQLNETAIQNEKAKQAILDRIENVNRTLNRVIDSTGKKIKLSDQDHHIPYRRKYKNKRINQTIEEARRAGNDLIKIIGKFDKKQKNIDETIDNKRAELCNRTENNKIDNMISNTIQLRVRGNADITLNTTHVEIGKKSHCNENALPEKIKDFIENEKLEAKQGSNNKLKHTSKNVEMKDSIENEKLEAKQGSNNKLKHTSKNVDMKDSIENEKLEAKQGNNNKLKHTSKNVDMKDSNEKLEAKQRFNNKLSNTSKNIEMGKVIRLLSKILESRGKVNDSVERSKYKLDIQIRTVRKELKEMKEKLPFDVGQHQEKRQVLKNIYDTRKTITRMGKIINGDMTLLMKYLIKSRKDIYGIGSRLLNDIQEPIENITKIQDDPKGTRTLLELIRKTTAQIMDELNQKQEV